MGSSLLNGFFRCISVQIVMILWRQLGIHSLKQRDLTCCIVNIGNAGRLHHEDLNHQKPRGMKIVSSQN